MKSSNTKWPLIALAVAICWACFANAADKNTEPEKSIRWFGKIVFAEALPSRKYPAFEHVVDSMGKRIEETGPLWNITLDDQIEIGLRPDGVVVWRNAEK